MWKVCDGIKTDELAFGFSDSYAARDGSIRGVEQGRFPLATVSVKLSRSTFCCSPNMTKKILTPGCRARLLAMVLGLGCAQSVLAESLPFVGRWLPDEPAQAQAASPILIIKDASLSWRGPNKSAPACIQQFALKKENPGTIYTDGHGTRFVAGVPGSIPTYLLKLSANTCGSPDQEVRIRFPLIYDTNHIELLEYANGKPVSSRRFHRKK